MTLSYYAAILIRLLIRSFIRSFIQAISRAHLQVHYYSEALPAARPLCRSFMHAQAPQAVKDLLQVPTWQLERESNPRPFRRKATNLPMSNHALLS